MFFLAREYMKRKEREEDNSELPSAKRQVLNRTNTVELEKIVPKGGAMERRSSSVLGSLEQSVVSQLSSENQKKLERSVSSVLESASSKYLLFVG